MTSLTSVMAVFELPYRPSREGGSRLPAVSELSKTGNRDGIVWVERTPQANLGASQLCTVPSGLRQGNESLHLQTNWVHIMTTDIP